MTYTEILQQAELGNAEAQAEVGFCHFWGHKVDYIDYDEAVKWFKKSADQDCAYGQYWMQRCLSEGLGIERNTSLRKEYADKAFQWFTKEADQTNAKVQLYIGYCYQEGAGTNVNAKFAFEWYKKSATQGLADAEYCLAICYASEFGTEQNGDEYAKWTRSAAEHGNAPSQFNWASILAAGYANEGKPNYEDAVAWFKKAAEQGHVGAQLALANCYESGCGVEQSEQDAFLWYQKAADRGSIEAQEKVCSAEDLYDMSVELLNTNNEEYYERAYRYCLASYNKGGHFAAYNLALMHLNGTAPVCDAIFADRLLRDAHKYGNEKAQDTYADLMQMINTFAPNAIANPILPSAEVPVFDGIEDSIKQFDSITVNGAQGALCGRIGSICNYPLVELKKSREFQSVCGETLGENPSDGICLHVTFVQATNNLTTANIEEAFYFQIFKQLDIFNEFTCFINADITNSENTVGNIWEFVVDCNHDIDKAKRIASSLIYHLYGYKKGWLYPTIFLDIQTDQMQVIPSEDASSYIGTLYCNVENFNWLDTILLSICMAVGVYLTLDEGIGTLIFVSIMVPICYIAQVPIILARINFKKLKFPKRNYIRLFRNPNNNY